MKTKIVYVLVSSPEDYFLEQAYVSMYSLKKYNPSAFVVVVCDEETHDNVTNNQVRNHFAEYIDEWKCLSFNKDISNKERSRWIKTSLRNILDGDLLFVDTDTIICGDLSGIDYQDSELAITLDLHSRFNEHPYKKSIENMILNMYGESIPNGIQYFNSGVIYMKDTDKCRRFFERWHKNWQSVYRTSFGCFDQQPLIKTIIDFNGFVTELSGDYNCQLLGSVEYLHTAKIVHFFNTQWCNTILSPLFDKNFYYRIKEKGCIDESQKYIIDNCKSSMKSPSMPIGLEDMQIWISPFIRYIREIKQFTFLERITLYILKSIYLISKMLKQYTHRGGGKTE